MSQATFSFYDVESGEFSTRTYAGPASDLAANTPAGHQAVLGVYCRETSRFDKALGRVVVFDESPPAFEKIKQLAEREVMLKIIGVEARQARPLRELQLAAALGNAPPPQALVSLQSIDQELSGLRSRLTLITAAQEESELPS